MQPDQTAPKTIDEYIAGFPPDIQARLEAIRATIRQAAPAAQEAIKYQIPTFVLNGNLLSFAAYKKHIGVYPRPAGDEAFRQALAVYEDAKSSYHFPLDQPLPLDLISQIVTFRVQETLVSATAKRK